MSNDGHVTDVSPTVHQLTDLLNGEAVVDIVSQVILKPRDDFFIEAE